LKSISRDSPFNVVWHCRYETKSEVLEYKSAADVTLPRKRELEEGDQEKPKPKKIKVSSRSLKGQTREMVVKLT
jgi:hypothetical protein